MYLQITLAALTESQTPINFDMIMKVNASIKASPSAILNWHFGKSTSLHPWDWALYEDLGRSGGKICKYTDEAVSYWLFNLGGFFAYLQFLVHLSNTKVIWIHQVWETPSCFYPSIPQRGFSTLGKLIQSNKRYKFRTAQ